MREVGEIPMMNAPVSRLNVGCGVDVKQGWINLDSANLPGVDVVHDIQVHPLPFGDSEFDFILCQDVLEHVEYIPVLRELHRILKKGGSLVIRVPHFTSRNNFIDPTHRKLFSVNTWDFFITNSSGDSGHIEEKRGYYFDFVFGEIRSRYITFEKNRRVFYYNRLAERFFNRSLEWQVLYESTFLSRLFPAENILLEVIK